MCSVRQLFKPVNDWPVEFHDATSSLLAWMNELLLKLESYVLQGVAEPASVLSEQGLLRVLRQRKGELERVVQPTETRT